MDKQARYQNIVKKVLMPFAGIRYANGDITTNPLFDKEHDHYVIMTTGWQNVRRVHGCLLHLDIINNQVWIQRDGTEDGIADALLAEGIPKEDIVLGFHSAGVRPLTGFGVGVATDSLEGRSVNPI